MFKNADTLKDDRRRQSNGRALATGAKTVQRVYGPIDPIDNLGLAHLKLGDTLLGGGQFGLQPLNFIRKPAFSGRLACGLRVFGSFNFRGVAFSHGPSSPLPATRSTRAIHHSWKPRYVRHMKHVNKGPLLFFLHETKKAQT